MVHAVRLRLRVWSGLVQGGFSYSGQRCTAVKVVLVMEEVADELVKKVNKGVEELTVGMPEESTHLICSHVSCAVCLVCCNSDMGHLSYHFCQRTWARRLLATPTHLYMQAFAMHRAVQRISDL